MSRLGHDLVHGVRIIRADSLDRVRIAHHSREMLPKRTIARDKYGHKRWDKSRRARNALPWHIAAVRTKVRAQTQLLDSAWHHPTLDSNSERKVGDAG